MSIVHDRELSGTWPDMGERLCIVCGQSPTQPHHMPPKGMAGERGWKGAILRLCPICHSRFHRNELELAYMGRWMWRGIDGRGIQARRWTPCHNDDFWHEIGGFR